MKGRTIAVVSVLVTVVGMGIAQVSAQTASSKSTVEDIRKELLQLPCYGVFDFLAFNYEKGTVTLVGYAYRPALKSYAPSGGLLWGHRHAFVERGLMPLGPSRFPGMEPVGDYPIHIIVKQGRSTLLGVVDSESDKTVAGMKTRECRAPSASITSSHRQTSRSTSFCTRLAAWSWPQSRLRMRWWNIVAR